MKLYSLSGDILYESARTSLRGALEEACRQRVHLGGVNLRRARLKGARLGGLIAPAGCFWGSELSGADMTGANLSAADLRMVTCRETCFARTCLQGADLAGAYFKSVLLAGADLRGCTFSCPSILSQALHLAQSLGGAVYWHKGEVACDLGAGVTRLAAGGHDIVLLGSQLMVNGRLMAARDDRRPGYPTVTA